MNDLSVYEIDRVLALLTPIQLDEHKQTLAKECQELAVELIESTNSIDVVLPRYKYKKDIIRRICVQETLNVDKKM